MRCTLQRAVSQQANGCCRYDSADQFAQLADPLDISNSFGYSADPAIESQVDPAGDVPRELVDKIPFIGEFGGIVSPRHKTIIFPARTASQQVHRAELSTANMLNAGRHRVPLRLCIYCCGLEIIIISGITR